MKPSDPIPIGSSHTVSGHEAMDLAKKLSAELANQAQSYGFHRATSPDTEPRARSYDHSSQNKGKRKYSFKRTFSNALKSILKIIIKNQGCVA